VTGLTGVRTVVDFVDVDSAKWEAYGRTRSWPLSGLFRREGDRLLSYERAVARRADASVFVTAAEANLFCRKAPECAARVWSAQNGVDASYFAPDTPRASPFAPDEEAIVFTGAMDYWPNVDAVCWFAQEVLPAVQAARPRARFHIVGMQPAPTVQALARLPGVLVTGRVPDVRPYLAHARVVVAPLRVARGIQNKVLEAMAMARPVVASACAALGLSAVPGTDIEVADDAADFAARTCAAMDAVHAAELGAAARARVTADYDWAANLAPFGRLLEPGAARAQAG
jgi:sugar transferase (PEP-CTERM/EpsH1 system associated)